MFLLSNDHIGLLGELFACFLIRQKTNLESLILPRGSDLRLSNGILIEVKTIHKNKDSTYRATIEKTGSQAIGQSDYVLLLVIADDLIYPYIIPAHRITGKRISITTHPSKYKGKYSEYLGRFDQLIIPTIARAA